MSLPIILCRAAQAEYGDAGDWFEARRLGGGAAFIAAVRAVLDAAAAQPDRWPVVGDAVREASVPGYSYVVCYRADPNQITVPSVFHTSRDPAVWQSRS